jgi:hypothetical protein
MPPSTVLLARLTTEEAVREPDARETSNRRMHRPYIVAHDKHSRFTRGSVMAQRGDCPR